MNKATIFISTAAMMAGTACGVWAETDETSAASFDRAERSVYDSSVVEHIAPAVNTGSNIKYSAIAAQANSAS